MSEGSPTMALERGEKLLTPPAIWFQAHGDIMHDYKDTESTFDGNEPQRFCAAYRQGRRLDRAGIHRHGAPARFVAGPVQVRSHVRADDGVHRKAREGLNASAQDAQSGGNIMTKTIKRRGVLQAAAVVGAGLGIARPGARAGRARVAENHRRLPAGRQRRRREPPSRREAGAGLCAQRHRRQSPGRRRPHRHRDAEELAARRPHPGADAGLDGHGLHRHL